MWHARVWEPKEQVSTSEVDKKVMNIDEYTVNLAMQLEIDWVAINYVLLLLLLLRYELCTQSRELVIVVVVVLMLLRKYLEWCRDMLLLRLLMNCCCCCWDYWCYVLLCRGLKCLSTRACTLLLMWQMWANWRPNVGELKAKCGRIEGQMWQMWVGDECGPNRAFEGQMWANWRPNVGDLKAKCGRIEGQM